MGLTWKRVAFVMGLGLLGFQPGAAGQRGAVSVMAGNACDGLDGAECCAQTVKTHAFRALGERLPKRGRLVVDLACKQPAKKLPAASCHTLLVARGWEVPSAKATCQASAMTRRCRDDKACGRCAKAITQLGFSRPEPVCLGATHLAATSRGTPTVVIRDGEIGASGAEVTRARTVLE